MHDYKRNDWEDPDYMDWEEISALLRDTVRVPMTLPRPDVEEDPWQD